MTHHSFAPIVSVEPAAPSVAKAPPYEPPAVVYEAALEVRAGSSIGGIPDPANPLDLP